MILSNKEHDTSLNMYSLGSSHGDKKTDKGLFEINKVLQTKRYYGNHTVLIISMDDMHWTGPHLPMDLFVQKCSNLQVEQRK